jgi:hypothetical protein
MTRIAAFRRSRRESPGSTGVGRRAGPDDERGRAGAGRTRARCHPRPPPAPPFGDAPPPFPPRHAILGWRPSDEIVRHPGLGTRREVSGRESPWRRSVVTSASSLTARHRGTGRSSLPAAEGRARAGRQRRRVRTNAQTAGSPFTVTSMGIGRRRVSVTGEVAMTRAASAASASGRTSASIRQSTRISV